MKTNMSNICEFHHKRLRAAFCMPAAPPLDFFCAARLCEAPTRSAAIVAINSSCVEGSARPGIDKRACVFGWGGVIFVFFVNTRVRGLHYAPFDFLPCSHLWTVED